jgi:hypothetical protein
MQQYTELTDDFGRRTVFTGERLADEHSDTSEGNKPQWVEISVWRTAGGRYVVRRVTRYRVRHLRDDCRRAEGYGIVEPTEEDTYACSSCNKRGVMEGGYAQADRTTVDAYRDPQELIIGLETSGRHSNLARAILADLSAEDPAIDAAWSTVVVP